MTQKDNQDPKDRVSEQGTEEKPSKSQSDGVGIEASMSSSGKIGWGPISAGVSITGSESPHSVNTKKRDKSVKYHVAVHSTDPDIAEGLSRALDKIAASVAPSAVKKDDQEKKQESN